MEQDYKPGTLPYPEQDDRKMFCTFHYKGVLVILIPLIFAPIFFSPPTPAYRFIYLAMVFYSYYLFNVIPVGALAFLFIAFMPPLGIMDSKVISRSYYADIIFTTYGSIFMGLMMDASKLSDRLAMMVISGCGTNIRMLQFCFMIMTASSSIFFCSTFMCAFWMKIAQAMLKEFADAGILKIVTDEEPYERQSPPYPTKPVIGIYLTIAYSATLGAMASPFQDPNSSIVYSLRSTMAVKNAGILALFLAPMIGGLIVTAIWINIIFLGLFPGTLRDELGETAAAKNTMIEAITDKRKQMGKWPIHCILALFFILLTMVLLVLRDPQIWDSWHGWNSNIHGAENYSSVPIILMCILYIAIPANYIFCRYYCCQRPEKEGIAPSMVGWKLLNHSTPWAQMLMLAAGNCAMAAYEDTKLINVINNAIVRKGYSKTSCLYIGSMIATYLTNLSPATSVIRHTLESVSNADELMKIGKGGLLVPYATAIHNQFLLPVSTSSNTIISGWGNIRPFEFMLGGVVPTVFMTIFIAASTHLIGGTAFIGY
ncbi:hypothetical protein AWZ03_007115 [Drosophila navojoa]|uniref:Citrate transporter-like domain-containing protein n=1 Tax=Drosophila navojoa TaxID=7232 RepID=A0A484BCL4_DRONA|nr:protein I'm not dead yet [Drosophila navojoa]TDG46459.1 hypothetical protein AWZ03_007115 [Drosophila navojoa]